MALLSSRARYLLLGAGIGAGVVLLTPIVVPVAIAVARPFTKALLKQTWLVFERSRESAARMWEGLEDLVAEVRAEVDDELRGDAERGPEPPRPRRAARSAEAGPETA